MKVLYVILFVLIAAGMSACLNDKPDEMIGFNPCDTTYYALTIRPLVQTHCMGNNAGCHITGGSGSGDFAHFINLKDKIDAGSFQDRLFNIKDMPPVGSVLPELSDSDRTILQNWVNDGYPGCD